MPAYQHHTDNQLLSLLKEGDDKAFNEIYDRYWKLLFSLAFNLMQSLPDTEDIVQEVFTYLWKKRETIEINHSLKSYLAAATKIQVYQFLLRSKKQQAREGIMPASSPLTPENELDFKNLLESLQKNINELPQTTRLIFHLKEEGLTNKEVADVIGISVKTVESHTTITKRRLRTGLDYLFIILFR